MLVAIGQAFPQPATGQIRTFITGSGSGPLAAPLGSKFVQEVNAVTLAVEQLHPDVGSVIELGGQDAKIIIFKEARDEDGELTGKTAIASMNDKCASGTGATIDKCFMKVGMPSEDAMQAALRRLASCTTWPPSAACSPRPTSSTWSRPRSRRVEIMCSLADAIVMQNLSVLTRGNTLRHKVLLLGGPNTYLPFLQDCWRKRIPETWESRGYAYPKDVPHRRADHRPRERAVLRRVRRGDVRPVRSRPTVGVYRGLDNLKEFIHSGRKSKLGDSAGPPLARTATSWRPSASSTRSRSSSRRSSRRAPRSAPSSAWTAGRPRPRRCWSTRTRTSSRRSTSSRKGNPIQDVKEILARLQAWVTEQGCTLEVLGFGATGYAADVLEKTVKSDVNIVETVAHMMSATTYFGDVDVVCDIGGQDIKVLFMQNGDIKNFRLSNQCSAGNGMLLQAMADQFGVKITDYAETAFGAELSPKFSYGCAVFLDSDRVNFQKEGYSKEELLVGPGAGAAQERLAVRGADPAHGLAGQEVRPAGRDPVQPGGGQGPGRLHQGAGAGRRGLRAPALRRGGRDRRRVRDPAGGQAARLLDLRRHRRRHQPALDRRPTTRPRAATSAPTTARRTFIDAVHARRRHRPLHQRLFLREGHGRIRRGDAGADRRAQEAEEAVTPTWSTPNPSCCSGTSTIRSRCPRTASTKQDVEVEQTLLGRPAGRGRAALPALAAPRPGSGGARLRIGIPHDAQHLVDRAVLAHLPRDPGHPAAARGLLRRDHRGDVGRGRQVRIDRSLLPVEGGPGAHPQPAVPPPQRRKAAALTSSTRC